ncbi:MAG: ArsR family transcriptional regulator, arsenate/arsenite/antimonite-responsive transcriptional [Nocardioidaceae bacterium]|nr:ArsR family transcriptional regulator, arsenate/arsenite/antimonite-responsive transcriptional [Nocardioidaceae bacterium]
MSPERFLQLIADPHRWRLLGELARSDRRVGELTQLLGQPQNLVSYHLRELRDAGLVFSRRSSFDGRDAYYRVDLTRCGELLAGAGAALVPGLRLASVSVPRRRRAGRAPRVLFLCTGNSARSQMGEALLERLSDHTIHARSAGSHPKMVHPNAIRVMAERGIDISGHRTKHLGLFARRHFDYVITLCDRVREVCPEFPGEPPTSHWSIPDPAAEGDTDEATYPAFERTACELEARIGHLIAQLSTTEGGHVHAA